MSTNVIDNICFGIFDHARTVIYMSNDYNGNVRNNFSDIVNRNVRINIRNTVHVSIVIKDWKGSDKELDLAYGKVTL